MIPSQAATRPAASALLLTGAACLVALGLLAPNELGLAWRLSLAGLVVAGVALAWRSEMLATKLGAADESRGQLATERLTVAMQIAGVGVWDWDLRTHTIHYSEVCSVMLGYPPGEIESNISAWGKLVHPADLDRVRHALDAHLDGRVPLYEVEVRLRAYDGSWRWIVDRGRVVEREADGTALRAIGVHMDISGRKIAMQAANSSAADEAPPAACRGTILIVDDDSAMLVVMEKMASMAGYEVRGAASAELALGLLQRDPAVDVIVTDQELGGMPGLEFAGQVAALGITAPVLLISAQDPPRLGDLSSVASFLPKPFGTQEFQAQLARLLPTPDQGAGAPR